MWSAILAFFHTFTLCICMQSLIKIYQAVKELWAFFITGNRRTHRFIHCLSYMPAVHVFFLWLFLGCSRHWAARVYIFVIFMSGSTKDSTTVILVLKHLRRKSLIGKTGRVGNQTWDLGFLVTIFDRLLQNIASRDKFHSNLLLSLYKID